MHQCVACRHAVEQARLGEMQIARGPAWQTDRQTDRQAMMAASGFPVWRWAMGVAVVIVAGVATLALWNGSFPGQHMEMCIRDSSKAWLLYTILNTRLG